MSTIRVSHNAENPYFMACRRTAQDKTLSYEARGMLMYLLSKPDNWKVQPKDLECEGCGRDKVYSILKELMACHYIEHERLEPEEGKPPMWGDYVVHESPFPENPDTAEPDTEKPDITYIESTEERSTKTNAVVPTAAIYGSYKDRVPPAMKGKPEGEEEKGYLTLSSPNLPAVVYSVFSVLERTQATCQRRISQSNLKLLYQPVSTSQGLYNPPTEMAETYPTEWKAFVESIEEMPSWVKRVEEGGEKVGVKLIIDHLRGYHWKGGWLEWMPDSTYTATTQMSDEEEAEWLRNQLG